MDLYSYVCRSVLTPLYFLYNNNNLFENLKYLMESQYSPSEVKNEINLKRLQAIVTHAYNNTEYYRNMFTLNGFSPSDIKVMEDIKKIPVLCKEDVINNQPMMIAKNFDKYVNFETTGSTGIPIKGYRNKKCQEWKMACGLRNNMWAGYRLGERIYCIYGNPKEKIGIKRSIRRKLLTREEFLDSLNLTEQSMQLFANMMMKRPPSLLWGHTHNMYLFAKFIKDRNIDNIKPKGMYSAGMVMHRWEREMVEDVFKCEFQNRYGCEEVGLIASECKKKEGLHINDDDIIVEVLDKNNQKMLSSEIGEITVTDLSNYVMPFIRYKLSDMGSFAIEVCSCGRTQPMLSSIQGRVSDFIVRTDGSVISGISLTDHFGANIRGIKQIQIVQKRNDLICLNIAKNELFSSDTEKEIKVLSEKYFGFRMRVEFNYVPRIMPGKGGKFKFVVSEIKNPFL
jgi:phenylacetate-CoA ligase